MDRTIMILVSSFMPWGLIQSVAANYPNRTRVKNYKGRARVLDYNISILFFFFLQVILLYSLISTLLPRVVAFHKVLGSIRPNEYIYYSYGSLFNAFFFFLEQKTKEGIKKRLQTKNLAFNEI
jgi:hypothetical protein